MGKNLSFLFPDFPAEESWRLLMDGESQGYGALYFGIKEPGYMVALMDSFCFMLENLGRRMDESFYYELHKRAVNGVCSRDTDSGAKKPMIGGYVKKGTTSDLSSVDVSLLELYLKAYNCSKNISPDKVVCNDKSINSAEIVVFSIYEKNASLKGVFEYENKKILHLLQKE